MRYKRLLKYYICFYCRHHVIFSLIALIPASSFAQIVNIESKRIQGDTTGWFGKLGTNFLLEKNTVQVITIGASAHLEYKTAKSLYLLLVNYDLLRGDMQTFNDNLFYHLRYNYKINNWLKAELFTQLQKNNVTGIKLRWLAGGGPRFKLLDNKKISLYAATAVMYEHEDENTSPPVYHRDIRSSNYISFTYEPRENMELKSVFFYQPLFSNLGDYRILNQLSIKYTFLKHFSFVTAWYYLYDSMPAAETPKTNYRISNGIEYDF